MVYRQRNQQAAANVSVSDDQLHAAVDGSDAIASVRHAVARHATAVEQLQQAAGANQESIEQLQRMAAQLQQATEASQRSIEQLHEQLAAAVKQIEQQADRGSTRVQVVESLGADHVPAPQHGVLYVVHGDGSYMLSDDGTAWVRVSSDKLIG